MNVLIDEGDRGGQSRCEPKVELHDESEDDEDDEGSKRNQRARPRKTNALCASCGEIGRANTYSASCDTMAANHAFHIAMEWLQTHTVQLAINRLPIHGVYLAIVWLQTHVVYLSIK